MWRAVPERRVDPQNLLDNGTNIGEILLVFGDRPAASSHNVVEFVVSTGLNVWMLADESEEPLNDAGSLKNVSISV
jgi:hypothetical protein